MRLWILKNRSWKQLNPLQLLPVPLWSQLQQPRGSWWLRERWVNRTCCKVVGESIKNEYRLLKVLLKTVGRSFGMTNENVNCSLLITIHGPGLVLFKNSQSHIYLNLTSVVKCWTLQIIQLWGVLLWGFFTSWRSVIPAGNGQSPTTVWGSKPKCHHVHQCSGPGQQKASVIVPSVSCDAMGTGLSASSGHFSGHACVIGAVSGRSLHSTWLIRIEIL